MADPQRTTAPATTPATGAADPRPAELSPDEEPVATGTLFLMILMLMLIAGIWTILYQTLLSR